MFIGHFAVAMGAKSVAPRVSLGTLIIAAQFLDLLWPALLLAGIESVRIVPGIMEATSLEFVNYPISHSLLAVLGWALLVGGLYWTVRRHARGAWVLGAAVVSHWILDLIVHQPDLPDHPRRRPTRRTGHLEFAGGDARDRARSPRARGGRLSQRHAVPGCRRAIRLLGARDRAGRHLPGFGVRTAAAGRALARRDGPGRMVAGPLGVLDRPPPDGPPGQLTHCVQSNSVRH